MVGRTIGRELLRYGTWPLLMVGGVGAAAWLSAAGVGSAVAVALPTFIASMLLLVMQRVIPFEASWRGRPSDFGIDLLHLIVTSGAGELGRAVVFGLAVQASVALGGVIGGALWPASWPLLAQLAVALVIGDLGAYWVHRLSHRLPLLWRLHAMHHSSERLYVFAAGRTHPLAFVLVWSAQAVPLLLLGAPEAVLVLVAAFTAIHGMLQHANVDLRHGWLNHVFATADLHRWHHSARFEESNANYGSNLIVWDWVFQTRFLPDDRRAPERVGIDGLDMPHNWWAHLASPLLLPRWERPPGGVANVEPAPARLDGGG